MLRQARRVGPTNEKGRVMEKRTPGLSRRLADDFHAMVHVFGQASLRHRAPLAGAAALRRRRSAIEVPPLRTTSSYLSHLDQCSSERNSSRTDACAAPPRREPDGLRVPCEAADPAPAVLAVSLLPRLYEGGQPAGTGSRGFRFARLSSQHDQISNVNGRRQV